MTSKDRRALIFMWEQFAPYHIDRLEALAAEFGDRYVIVGIEVASSSLSYAWKSAASNAMFQRHLLFPDKVAESIPWHRKLLRSLQVIRRYRPAGVFLCNQNQPEILAALALLSLRGVPCFAMFDAKFDDRPRRVLQEATKRAVLRLFSGGLVGAGSRHLDYFRFLGMPERWIVPGYLTLSVDRVRREAGVPLSPAGPSHAERDFIVVARFIPKKNIATAIHAYALYRQTHPGTTRRLMLCGSGPLEDELRQIAGPGVEFTGFLDPDAVSRVLAKALALLLPSQEEQWGLVVNEAIALNIPVLCSDNVGARDTLVRTGVNGFIFEVGNTEGLARFMSLLADDPALWRTMSEACLNFVPLADVAVFAQGVARLIGAAIPDDGNLLPARWSALTSEQTSKQASQYPGSTTW